MRRLYLSRPVVLLEVLLVAPVTAFGAPDGANLPSLPPAIPVVAPVDVDGGAPPPAPSALDGGVPAVPAPGTTTLDSNAADGGVPSPVTGGAGAGDTGPAVDAGVAAAEPARGADTEPKVKKGFVGIYGKLIDSRTKDALIEAQAKMVKPLPARTGVSDVEGNYKIKLAPGTYDLRVFYELYKARRISGVVVKAGEATRLDVELTSDSDAVQEVVVEARADTTTEAVQLVTRQKAATVSDAVSAEQIARSPDSNASDAAKRVVGVTIENDKYVIVRGLSGRYSITLLNNVPLPSPDPDVPAAPLDLFPSALLANLTVSKSFIPDMPGNFVGGALNIETRSFPTSFKLNIALKGTGDTASTFRETYGYSGGRFDFFGFDDGTRRLPTTISRNTLLPTPVAQGPDQVAAAQSWSNNWVLNRRVVPPGFGLTLTLGDTFKAGTHKVGLNASVNYGFTATRRIKRISAVGEADGAGGFLPSPFLLTDEESSDRSTLGGLLTLGWIPTLGHSLNLTGIYAHNTEKAADFISGVDQTQAIIERIRMRFTERSMLVGQLVGEHNVWRNLLLLNWQGNVARVSQNEPDTRDLLRAQIPDTNPSRYVIGNQSGGANRLFSNLVDLQGGGGADLSVVLRPLRIKFGGSYLYAVRDYQARRFEFRANQETSLLPVDRAFAAENLGTNVTFGESTRPSDGVGSNRGIGAGYAMVDVTALKQVRFLAGARLEVSDLSVFARARLYPSDDQCAGNPNCKPDTFAPFNRRDIDVLPSASVVGHITDKMNLRAAYGMTLARPNFREVSPAQYFDYVRRRVESGDPSLIQSKIHNADLRFEWFFGTTELLGASAFYKYMEKPIERYLSTDGNIFRKNNDFAHVAGLELEARISLGRLYLPLTNLTVGGNLSVIYSQVNFTDPVTRVSDPKRALQGQSPYGVNLDVSYHYVPSGSRFSLLYNVFGPRITEVGTAGNANVQDEPVHKLDFVYSQKLPARLRFKVAVTNILNSALRQTQNGVEILGYDLGVGFSGTLELNLE